MSKKLNALIEAARQLLWIHDIEGFLKKSVDYPENIAHAWDELRQAVNILDFSTSEGVVLPKWILGSEPPDGWYLDGICPAATIARLEKGMLYHRVTYWDPYTGEGHIKQSKTSLIQFLSRRGNEVGVLYGPILGLKVTE